MPERLNVIFFPPVFQAVQEYYHLMVKNAIASSPLANLVMRARVPETCQDLVAFDDGSVVVVTKSDLEGYDPSFHTSAMGSEILADLRVVYRVRVAGQAALARISCLWLRCNSHQKISGENLSNRESSCSIGSDNLGGINVGIHVY